MNWDLISINGLKGGVGGLSDDFVSLIESKEG